MALALATVTPFHAIEMARTPQPTSTPENVLALLASHGVRTEDLLPAFIALFVGPSFRNIVRRGRSNAGKLEASVREIRQDLEAFYQSLQEAAGKHRVDRAVAAAHGTVLNEFARALECAAAQFSDALAKATARLDWSLAHGHPASARRDVEVADVALEVFRGGTTLNTTSLIALATDLRSRVPGLTDTDIAILLIFWRPLRRPWTHTYTLGPGETVRDALDRVTAILRQERARDRKSVTRPARRLKSS